MDFKSAIKEYYEREKRVIDNLDYEKISDAMNVIKAAYEAGSTIYVCGNGFHCVPYAK